MSISTAALVRLSSLNSAKRGALWATQHTSLFPTGRAPLSLSRSRALPSQRLSSSSPPPPPPPSSSSSSPPPPSSSSSPPPPSSSPRPPSPSRIAKLAAMESTAGTGNPHGRAMAALYARTRDRGPVSWRTLFLASVAAVSAVAYFRIDRERRLEQHMGKIVSSESSYASEGWSPRPEFLAKRKFVATKWGWFPEEDAFGARELFV